MISEQDILVRLRNGEIQFPPLRLEVDRQLVAWKDGWVGEADAYVTIQWGELEEPFIVEIKRRVSAKVLREVMASLKAASYMTERNPLLITDWLAPEQIVELEQLGVSGIDLNGNGVITVPGKILVSRTGAPNQYRESVPLRNAYRGESAMVARMFLLRPEFQKVEDVWREIQERGGQLSMPAVSKALKVLEEDLVISKKKASIKVLQPEVLLDRLVANYRQPLVVERWLGRCSIGEDISMMPQMIGNKASNMIPMKEMPKDKSNVGVVLTGESSAARWYQAFAREPVWRFYVKRSLDELLREVVKEFPIEETRRFPNLELYRIEATWPGFDARRDTGKSAWRIWSSPLQTYLELATGDQRQRDSALALRKIAVARGWRFNV